MKLLSWSRLSDSTWYRTAFVVATVAFAGACGGDDTEVVVLKDSGQDRTSGDGSGGKDGSQADSGTGGALAGRGGSGGAGTAGSAGTGGRSGGGAAGAGGSSQDASGGSAGTGRDGGSGAGSGGADAGADNADGGSLEDTGDAGGSDVGNPDADAGPLLTISEYQHAISVAWCDRMAECCQLSSTQFDRDKCIAAVDNGAGPERVTYYLYRYKVGDGGFPTSLAFDPIQAAQCVELQRNRGCTSEDGAEKRNIYATCMTAPQGSVAQNGVCKTSLDCRSGLYCPPVGETGTSTCTPLAAVGQSCDDPNFNGDRCTYLGIHSSGSAHCSPLGSGAGVCAVGLPIASGCSVDQECASGVCSSVSRSCVNSQPYPSPATCTTYTKVSNDGGDAG
jgi:hypothetical protein